MYAAHVPRCMRSVRRTTGPCAAVQGIALSLAVLVLGSSGCSSSPPEPAPQAVAKPTLPNVYQVGPVVDLLAMVDPQRDSVHGPFRKQDDSLIIPSVRAAQLNLDVDLPEQYELFLDVAKTRGNQSLNLGISVGGHQAVVVIEGWQDKTNGISLIDNRLGLNNETSNQFPVFTDNTAKSIRIIVRRESVLVDVEGNVFIDYRGPASRLGFDERFFKRPKTNQLMLGGWETEFRVSKWKLTPLGDQRVDFAKPTEVADEGDKASNSLHARTGMEAVRQPELSTPAIASESTTVENQDSAPEHVASEQSGNLPDTQPLVPWQAVVDPFPGWDGAAVANLSIPLHHGSIVVPNGPSPFFMAGETSDQSIRWRVYDVRTGNAVGTPCELSATDAHHPSLCPSGRYMMSYTGMASERHVVVHSFVSGEQVYQADSPNDRTFDAARDLFALNHTLLQVRGSRQAVEVQRSNLRTGQIESPWSAETASGGLKGITVSPGGRYVLIHDREQLSAYEITTGLCQGQIALPAGLIINESPAFSLDGTELALLARVSGRPSPTLWCIDWSAGETVLQADVQAEVQGLSNNYTLGPALEWFPNKELLLYYGRDVFDRRTGKYCCQIPSTLYWESPRRTVGNRAILGLFPNGDADHQVYRAISLDDASVDAALDVVRRGGIAADVGLPPLTVAEQTDARRVTPMEDRGKVSVLPTERPAFPAVKLPLLVSSFQNPGTELRRIEFADPPHATAVLHVTFNKRDDTLRRDMVVRFDLARGKPLGSVAIHKDFRLIGVSPDGTRAMIGQFNQVDAYSRLDVVDLVGKQHVTGWRPFHNELYREDVSAIGQGEAKDPMTASWVRFVDNDRVVAINPAGKLVCWRLPECSVEYFCEDLDRPLAFSEDRRYLATAKGNSVAIFDVRDGSWVGELQPDKPPQAILRAGFSGNNDQLAAVLGYQGRRQFVMWDLVRGQVIEQFDLPYATVGSSWNEHQDAAHRQLGLDFRGNGYLTLDDLYLIDVSRKSVPWKYNVRRGKHIVNGPDDREWITEFRTVDHGRGQVLELWLMAWDLPSQAVLDMIRTAPASDSARPLGRSILSTTNEDAQFTPANR